MISLEEVQQQAAEAQQKALLAKLQYEFAKAFPELNCDANWDLLVKAHQGKPITLDSLITLIQHPEVKSKLAVKSLQKVLKDEAAQREREKDLEAKAEADALAAEAKEREKLAQQIKGLLKVSPVMLQNEMAKYQLRDAKGNWICPTEVMRTRLKTLQETSVFRGTSTEQLREHLRGAKPKETGYVDKRGVCYPFLPKDVSASQIRVMWDAATLRNGIKKYGNEQITERLQEYQEN